MAPSMSLLHQSSVPVLIDKLPTIRGGSTRSSTSVNKRAKHDVEHRVQILCDVLRQEAQHEVTLLLPQSTLS
jgi:hypothetical protein